MITNNNLIKLDIEIKNKDDALKNISKIMKEEFSLDENEIYQALIKRENEFSTGLGEGVSIPHASIDGLEEVKIVFLRYKDEID